MFRPIGEILTDPGLKMALAWFTLSLLALFGVPEGKQRQVENLINATVVLVGVAIAGKAYRDGKSVEGTVPNGREPAGGQVKVNVGGEPVAGPGPLPPTAADGAPDLEELLQVLDVSEPAAAERVRGVVAMFQAGHVPQELQTPALRPPEPPTAVTLEHRVGAPPRTGVATTALLFALLGLVGLTGCVGTSKPFKEGVYAGAKVLSHRAWQYAHLDPAKEAERVAAADRFTKATAVKEAITVQEVEAAWADVRTWLREAVSNDQAIAYDTNELRLDTIAEMDRLIMAERRRPLLFSGRPADPAPLGTPPPATGPARAPPAR